MNIWDYAPVWATDLRLNRDFILYWSDGARYKMAHGSDSAVGYCTETVDRMFIIATRPDIHGDKLRLTNLSVPGLSYGYSEMPELIDGDVVTTDFYRYMRCFGVWRREDELAVTTQANVIGLAKEIYRANELIWQRKPKPLTKEQVEALREFAGGVVSFDSVSGLVDDYIKERGVE